MELKKLTKYALPVILSVTAMLYADKKTLPFKETTFEQKIEYLDNLTNKAFNHIKNAENSFNRYVRKGYLDITQQELIIKYFESAETEIETIKKLSKTIPNNEKYQSLALSKQDVNLYKLLDKNIQGDDFGTVELEKELKVYGFNVEVENSNSNQINTLPSLGLFLFFMTSIIAIVSVYGRERIDDEYYN